MKSTGFPEISASDNIMFVADIHLKPAWSAALPDVVGDSSFGLEQVMSAAFENNVKLVILGGDVFDRNVLREADLITMFQRWVRSMHSNGVMVAAYPGNHDRVVSYGGATVKQFYEIAPEVVDINNTVFTVGRRVCFAMGFNDNPAEVAEIMLKLPKEVNTLFLHQNIAGVGLPTNNFNEDEVPAQVAEIYIGDIHMQIQGQNAHGAFWAYPGPMFPQEAGEDECGGLIFKATAPRHGVASWKRVQFKHRPTRVVDATMLAPSDVLMAERIVADAVDWAKAQSGNTKLRPIVFVKILSSSREHVPKIKAGINHGSGALVVVSYAPPATSKLVALPQGAKNGIPRPVDLVDAYVDSLKSADGRYLSLRRPAEARTLLRALFTPGSRADTAKGRVLAYRTTIKAHLDTL